MKRLPAQLLSWLSRSEVLNEFPDLYLHHRLSHVDNRWYHLQLSGWLPLGSRLATVPYPRAAC